VTCANGNVPIKTTAETSPNPSNTSRHTLLTYKQPRATGEPYRASTPQDSPPLPTNSQRVAGPLGGTNSSASDVGTSARATAVYARHCFNVSLRLARASLLVDAALAAAVARVHSRQLSKSNFAAALRRGSDGALFRGRFSRGRFSGWPASMA
jgi:hypothetical protein